MHDLQILLRSPAHDLPHIRIPLVDPPLLQLQSDNLTRQVNFPHIETTYPFYRRHIPLVKNLGRRIPEIFLPAPLIKEHLDGPAPALRIAERQIRQPVIYIQPVTSTGTAPAIALATRRLASLGSATITASHIPK